MSARTTTLALILASAALAVPNLQAAPPAAQPGAMTASAPSSTPVPMTPEQVKAVDADLQVLDIIVLHLEDMAKGGADGSGCPPDVSVGSLVADLKSKRASQSGDDVGDVDAKNKNGGGPKLDFQMYFLCKALSEKNPAACDSLASLTPYSAQDAKAAHQDAAPSATEAASHEAGVSNPTYDGICRRAYAKERARAAFIGRLPQFTELCRQYLGTLAPMIKGGAAGDAMCTAWRNFGGDPAPLAAAIRNGLAHPLPEEAVSDIAVELTADNGACSHDARGFDRRTCEEQQDYRKALAAKSPAACRGGLCRVEMGEGPRACEAYAAKFKSAACAQGYTAQYLGDQEKIFKNRSLQVEDSLTKAGPGGDVKALKEFNARLERLSDLRARFDHAADTLAPKRNEKKGAAAGKKG